MLQDKSVARFYCPFHRTPVAFVDDEYWLSINPGGEVNPPKYLCGYMFLPKVSNSDSDLFSSCPKPGYNISKVRKL